jgi:SH3-like domain-containing protein
MMPRSHPLLPAALTLLLALMPAAGAGAEEAAREDGVAPRGPAARTAVRRLGPSGLPLPRFVALRAKRVNLRTGPGIRYPIDWVYSLPGLPVEVIDEFETWRRIRDWQGSVGWVHQSMLTGARGALVVGERRKLRRGPKPSAPGVAWLESGVIARLKDCTSGWCELEVDGHEGWLRAEAIYGLHAGEALE